MNRLSEIAEGLFMLAADKGDSERMYVRNVLYDYAVELRSLVKDLNTVEVFDASSNNIDGYDVVFKVLWSGEDDFKVGNTYVVNCLDYFVDKSDDDEKIIVIEDVRFNPIDV